MNDFYAANTDPLSEEHVRLVDLIHMCKKINCFEVEGYRFVGELVYAVKTYIKQNPSDKFIVWLQNNYEQF